MDKGRKPSAGSAEEYYNSGNTFCKRQKWEDAAASYYAALQLKPDWAAAHFSLGTVLMRLKRLDGATLCFRNSIRLNPTDSNAYNYLGITYFQGGHFSKALPCFFRCVEYNPNNPLAYNNLGLTLEKLKRYPDAKINFEKAIKLNPGYAHAFNNLGLIYKQLKLLPQAIRTLKHAIEIQPDFLPAYNNLAAALINNNQFTEAETCLRQAIEVKPEFYETYRRLGVVLKKMRRFKEAELAYLTSVDLADSTHRASVLHSLGILYLLCGQFAKGWPNYEFRRITFQRHIYSPPLGTIPYWHGESLSGKSLLLFFEQGLGDTIQFIRYLPQIWKMAAKVTVIVQSDLRQLLSYSLKTELYDEKNLPNGHYDFACSLHSLPMIFKTSKATIPHQVPYLSSRKSIASKWSNSLAELSGSHRFRIGVVWAGNPHHENDCNRSIPFAAFQQLFAMQQIDWISLQVGNRATDLPESSNVISLFPALTDFQETAGVIENLDLVITVDSSVAHLAGSMGKPTWTLLPFDCDWRWQTAGDSSPWYPSMRLFRQSEPGNWQAVLSKVRLSLKNIVR